MARPPPPLVAMFGTTEDPRDVQARLDDEVRRLAHAEWLRTGNTDEYFNWHEAEKQLGARLIHTGTVQWLYRELAARENQLAETSAKAQEMEGRCAKLSDSAALTERLKERDASLREMGTALSGAEARLASREAALRGEIAAEQAKLATCESQIREIQPELEAQTQTLAKRTHSLAERDALVQSLTHSLEQQEHDASARASAEERCQDLESALEATQAELTLRNAQLKQQDTRISDMEAWLGARREDLAKSLAQLAAQGQALREREEIADSAERVKAVKAKRESSRAQVPPLQLESPGAPEGHVARVLEDTVRRLQTELAERDHKLALERSRVGKLEAIEEDLHRELHARTQPQVLEMKPWEGHVPGSEGNVNVRPSGPEVALMSSREELSLQREEVIARDKKLQQQEAQTQALTSLLRARRAELDARGSQLQALQAQLAVRDQRIREQDRRAKLLEGQGEELRVRLQAQQCELDAGRAELEKRELEISVQSAMEERAAQKCEAQSEQIVGLKAELRQRDGEISEQRATERALVAHSARLREVEDSLTEACDRRVAQQEAQVQALSSLLKARTAELEAKGAHFEAQRAQLQAHFRRFEEQEEQTSRLEAARLALAEELEAEACKRAESDARLRESDACAEELGLSLQAHREELAASQVGIQARDEELAVLRRSRDEQVGEFEARLRALRPQQPKVEEELRAQQEEIHALEARLRSQNSEQQEELSAMRGQSASIGVVGCGLSKLEERLSHVLAKVRKAAEDAAEARQAAVVKRQSTGSSGSKQGLARSFLTVRGIDFRLLSAQPKVLELFKQALQETVAVEAGSGVSPQDVALELWGGSVVACCTISQPPGVSPASIEARLRSSTTLCRAVIDAVAKVEGIDQVTVGPLNVIVHDVRPEARSGSSTVSPSLVNHRGNPTPPPEPLRTEVQVPEPSSRFARMLSVLTPSRARWSSLERPSSDELRRAEDGAVRKRVEELERKQIERKQSVSEIAKAPSPAGEVAPSPEEAAALVEGDAPGRKASRQCFRSRAYHQ